MEASDNGASTSIKKRNSPSPSLDGSSTPAGSSGGGTSTPATKRPKVNRACAECKESHTACDTERPCARCVSLGLGDSCRDAECKKRGRPKKVKRNARGAATQNMPSIINGKNPPPSLLAMPNASLGISFGSMMGHPNMLGGVPFSSAGLQSFGPGVPQHVLPQGAAGYPGAAAAAAAGGAPSFHPFAAQLQAGMMMPPAATAATPLNTSTATSPASAGASFPPPVAPLSSSSSPAQAFGRSAASGYTGVKQQPPQSAPNSGASHAHAYGGYSHGHGQQSTQSPASPPSPIFSHPSTTINSSSPPSQPSPTVLSSSAPANAFPGMTAAAAAAAASTPMSQHDGKMLMSALSMLLKEVKSLKETTHELKQETLNLKNEQVLLREQFATFLSSQAAHHQQPSYSSSSSSSSVSSPQFSVIATSGAAAAGQHFSPPFGNIPPAPGHQQQRFGNGSRGTPPNPVPFFKGMPYIAVEGIHVPSFVIRNPNKPLVFVLRKKGLNGILAAVNYAFCRLFQFEMDEIVGCSWQKLVAPGEASRLLHLVIPFLKRFNKTYSPVLTIQPRCLTKDGTIFKAVTRHQFFYDHVGRPVWSAIALEGVILTGEEMNGSHAHIHQVRQAMGLDNWSEDGPTGMPHMGQDMPVRKEDPQQQQPLYNQTPYSHPMHESTTTSTSTSTSTSSSTSSSVTLTGGVPLGEPGPEGCSTGLAMNSTGRYSWAWMPPSTPPYISSPQLTMFEEDDPSDHS